MSDEVDSFISMFGGKKPSSRRDQRQARAEKERRTQLTDKQRHRGAVRTENLNFRCSPEFKAKLAGMQDHLEGKPSYADILEDALDMLAKAKGYN